MASVSGDLDLQEKSLANKMISIMSTSSKPNLQSRIRKNKKAIIIVASLIITILIPIVIIRTSIKYWNPESIVIRIDDVQDFAFKEAQLFLLNHSILNHVPLSLSIITGMFGADNEILQTVKLALGSGCEVAAHGWKHENLTELTLKEQLGLLFQARNQIMETLGVGTRTLVPPMFSFNQHTLDAMCEEGYDIISTSKDLHEPGLVSGVRNLPATVEFSDFSNGTWIEKSCESIKSEIKMSVERYGFAVIVAHPQEFMTDGELNRTTITLYETLLENLNGTCSFKTLEELSKDLGT